MESFCPTILSGCMGRCDLMVDSMEGAPGGGGFGNKLAVVGDNDLQLFSSLVFYCAMPCTKYVDCFALTLQGQAPDVMILTPHPNFPLFFHHLFRALGHSFPTRSLTRRSDRHQIT